MRIKYWGTVFWQKFQPWFLGQTGDDFQEHHGTKVFSKRDLYRAYNEGFRQGRLRGRREVREESKQKKGGQRERDE